MAEVGVVVGRFQIRQPRLRAERGRQTGETARRPDRPGCADGQEHQTLVRPRGCFEEPPGLAVGLRIDGLPEPDNVRSEQRPAAVASRCGCRLRSIFERRPVAIPAAISPERSMQLEYPPIAGHLVESVDVLRNEQKAIGHTPFGLGERQMSGVGPDLGGAAPKPRVESPNPIRIALEALGRGHILDTLAFPQPVRTAERPQAALDADAGAGQDEKAVRRPQIER